MMTNRKQAFILLLIVVLIIFSTASIFAAGEIVKVGIFDNPPKIFIDENKTVSGIYTAIIEYIAGKESWKIEYVYGTFQENLERVRKGEIDILVDVAYNEERAKYLEYNKEAVLTSYGVIFTKPDFKPVSFRELDGKKIATMKGSNFLAEDGYPEIEKLFGIKSNITETSDYETAFFLLESGFVDAVIANDVYGFYDKKIHPDSDYIFTELLFLPRNQFFAFPKNGILNELLINKIDSNLIELKADQTSIYYQEIYKMKGGYKEKVLEIPLWVKLVVLFITIILFISLTFILILNKQKRIIQETDKKLISANRLKDLFIDIMRHDLLNPVGVMRSNIQLLLGKERDLKKKDTLDRVNNNCNELIDRINSASLLSKLEEGKEKLEYSKVDLRKVMDNIFAEVSHLTKENNIKLVSKIKENGFFVNATPLIHDVFFNLITNAIKYNNKNMGVIVDIVRKEGKYSISVADRGGGVPDKYKKSIFERFSRLEKGAIKGTGLGLAITKKIVELHNGNVWVEDNPKGGSIFIVELPILKE